MNVKQTRHVDVCMSLKLLNCLTAPSTLIIAAPITALIIDYWKIYSLIKQFSLEKTIITLINKVSMKCEIDTLRCVNSFNFLIICQIKQYKFVTQPKHSYYLTLI